MRAKSEEPVRILRLAREADLHQHLAVITQICQRKSSKCNRRSVLASEQRHRASLGLGLLRTKRIEQLEPWGSGWGTRAAEGEDGQDHGSANASSSSSSTDSHHCSGQLTASGKENEVVLTPLLLFFFFGVCKRPADDWASKASVEIC